MDYAPRSGFLCLTLASLALALPACDKGSVGEFESETEGGTGSGSDSETASTSGSDSNSTSGSGSDSASTTGASASESATTGTTAGETTNASESDSDSDSDSDSATTTGASVCGGAENFMCSAPVDCGDACGTLDSFFDEEGCIRAPCSRHDDCDDGSVCYHPIDYGGCASSDVSCFEDENGVCQCGLDPDCGGSYCVPDEVFFGGASDGPTVGWVDNSCAPDDGPAFVITVGLDANACDAESDGGPIIRFLISAEPPMPGMSQVYELSQPDSNASYSPVGDLTDAEFVSDGIVRIFEWGDTIVGEYEIGLADTTVLVGSFSTPYCNSDIICG